jgi:hypothetical protein
MGFRRPASGNSMIQVMMLTNSDAANIILKHDFVSNLQLCLSSCLVQYCEEASNYALSQPYRGLEHPKI